MAQSAKDPEEYSYTRYVVFYPCPRPPSLSVLFPEQLEFFPEVFFLYKSVYLSHTPASPLPFPPQTNGSYNTHHSYLAFCTINKLDIIL